MAEPTEKQKIGRLGEDIAVKYLENMDFVVVERNYLKKCGEIDIIAKKGKILHFIEVKSVSCENMAKNWVFLGDVSLRPGREFANSETGEYRPEDNIHLYKLKRLARTIQVYLLEKYQNTEPEWVFDAITVRLDTKNRKASVKFLENLVL